MWCWVNQELGKLKRFQIERFFSQQKCQKENSTSQFKGRQLHNSGGQVPPKKPEEAEEDYEEDEEVEDEQPRQFFFKNSVTFEVQNVKIELHLTMLH